MMPTKCPFLQIIKKARNFYIPGEKKIKYKDSGVIDFPKGAVVTRPST